jgi:hypothetical protein
MTIVDIEVSFVGILLDRLIRMLFLLIFMCEGRREREMTSVRRENVIKYNGKSNN